MGIETFVDNLQRLLDHWCEGISGVVCEGVYLFGDSFAVHGGGQKARRTRTPRRAERRFGAGRVTYLPNASQGVEQALASVLPFCTFPCRAQTSSLSLEAQALLARRSSTLSRLSQRAPDLANSLARSGSLRAHLRVI